MIDKLNNDNICISPNKKEIRVVILKGISLKQSNKHSSIHTMPVKITNSMHWIINKT